MVSLLDINVLMALVDSNHVHHPAATTFFKQAMREGWATCPIVENGFVRILGHGKYPHGPGSPEEARRLLDAYTAAPGYLFWQDDLSIMDPKALPSLPSSKELTDAYLLALAVKHGGRLATFDRAIDPVSVPGGRKALHLLRP